MNDEPVLEKEYLEKVNNKTLFYPCSGNDMLDSIEIFSPYIRDFWFVDRAYFYPGQFCTRIFGLDGPADQQEPVLKNDRRYRLIDRNITGKPSWDEATRQRVLRNLSGEEYTSLVKASRDRDSRCAIPWNMERGYIEPCVLTETYLHLEAGKEIRIHRRRGYGYSAFAKEIHTNSLGVFFYRGDSGGEGGSGNRWLSQDRVESICRKMIDGGLFVLDGTDGAPYRRRSGVYRELYRKDKPPGHTMELIESRESFTDKEGNHFRCVGCARDSYYPTMIWQIKKAVP